MSKNVAVFVDVANIFYAAKAAGVDIDYVTLLKAATAGRDFVRAYAYTGLDPENENQRQFHAFLSRSGYKVISKDIRKYGDGRIKANLDIELVVDMMKTARNLDIAVVVSGDGDFAPAIRAVQEMGVRCEVISFRGNTSSDLIEVADLFTDIASIARVEKGSARSGRRVAAEGDLSMTEVPEKETEGAPRRRRGTRRDERPAAAAVEQEVVAAAAAQAANLVALPGERLSRAVGEEVAMVEPEAEESGFGGDTGNGVDAVGEDGPRRRRRRGGRGRGRGRRPEDEVVAGTEPVVIAAEDEEEFEELPPAQPPHHAFGSVWDSQLGVPSSSAMPPSVDVLGGAGPGDEEDFEEPEVPEYLLAERRQRGQRSGPAGRAGRPVGRGRGSYQAALDRERYGRSAPQPTYGGSTSSGTPNRAPDRSRDRGRQGGRPPQGGRPQDRGPRMPDRQMADPRPSSEPWSEVPPELEQMLRAELARKQPSMPASEVTSVEMAPTSTPAAAEETAMLAAVAAAETKPKRTTRTRTTKAATSAAEAVTSVPAAEAAPVDAKPKRTTTRSRTTKAATPAAGAAASEPAAEAAPAAEKPKRATRSRTTKAATPMVEEG